MFKKIPEAENRIDHGEKVKQKRAKLYKETPREKWAKSIVLLNQKKIVVPEQKAHLHLESKNSKSLSTKGLRAEHWLS